MSVSKLGPPTTSVRYLRLASSPLSLSQQLRRAFLHSSCSLHEEQRQSFKGQLLDSVAQRLEKERAEQRRFAKIRGEGSGGRAAATTFGTGNRLGERKNIR